MKLKFLWKIFSIVNSFSLVLQALLPLALLAPAQAYASTPPVATISWDNSGNKFGFSVSTSDSVEYSIAYQTASDQTRGLNGSGSDASGTYSKNDIYAGTCSTGGVCTPDVVDHGIYKFRDANQNWIYSVLFTINSGSLAIVKQGTDSTFDFTADETAWLNHPTTGNLNKIDLVSNNSSQGPPQGDNNNSGTQTLGTQTQSNVTTQTGSASLDQYGNAAPAGWQNGNLNANQATYREGDSVPYRITFGSLDNTGATTYSVVIGWQETNSSKHAIDYLTTYNRTVNPNPCDGVTGCSGYTSNTHAIPLDPDVSGSCGFSGTQVPGVFTLLGGTITGVSGYSVSSCPTGNQDNTITISFTANQTTPVLVWGGHIASQLDWGVGNSASSISGSPYHMLLDSCSFNCGAQDRALAAGAILPTPGVSTQISSGTITLGQSVFDTATFTEVGKNGPVSGTTTFTECGPGSVSPCVGGTQVGIPISISSDQASSSAFVPPSVGTYCFAVQYNPDSSALYSPIESNLTANECVTVNPAPVTVTTAIHNPSHNVVTSVPTGTTVHDSALVSDGLGTPTGTVTFTWFSNGTCNGNPTATSSAQTLTSGAVDATGFTEGPLSVGSYSFKAHYNGDNTYAPANSACEPLSVTIVSPSISTTPNPTSGNIGTALNDSALLSGGVNPTGTITFSLFNPSDATCSGTAAFTNVVSVSGNGTYNTSAGFTSNTSGTWHWKASYGGDSNNNPVTSTCASEPVTVNKVNSSVSTLIHNANHQIVTSIPAGSTVHDTATVSGSLATPTGNVVFNWFANNTCNGTPTATSGNIPLSGGTIDATVFPQGPLNAGQYSFNAHYAGDNNYNSSDSPCEPLTVGKIGPNVVTTIHLPTGAVVTGPVALGSTVSDSASVSGTFGTPTGTVDFTFYTSGDCSTGGAAAGTGLTLVSGNAGPSTSEGPLSTGSYSFKAHYNGDTNYTSGDSACEPLTVNKGTLSLTTVIDNNAGNVPVTGPVPLGTTVHDQATVSGITNNIAPTNPVVFTFFNTIDCTGQGAAAGSVAISGNTAGPSNSEGPLGTGSYSFHASIADDANYTGGTSACEPLTVNKGALLVTTTIHKSSDNSIVTGSLPTGSSVYDSATVSGITNNIAPINPVAFTFFNTSDCSGQGSAAGSVALSGNTASPSNTEGPLGAGSYSFHASIADDANYTGGTSACEPLTVLKSSPAISTIPNPTSGNIGGVLNDSASLTVGYNPTGTITFSLFNPSDASCSGTAAFTNAVSVSGNGTYNTSAGFTSNASGTWHWKASYGGDSNNNSVVSVCADEPVSVSKVNSAISTLIHNANHQIVTSVPAGSTVHDTATVSGSLATPTGNVVFNWFTNNTCTSTPAATSGNIALSGGIVDAATFPQGPLSAGVYSFNAHYNGDSNYNPSDSPCEPLTVSQLTPNLSTIIHLANGTVVSGPIALGSSVSDEADASGSFGVPTGNVNFTFFPNGSCTVDTGASAGTVALNGSGVASPSNTKGPLSTGSYSFKAHYVGDTNYTAIDSGCEPLSVGKGSLSLTTVIDNNAGNVPISGPVVLGTTVHDQATISGITNNIAPTNPVVFTFFNTVDCSGQGTAAGSVALSGNTAGPSDSEGPLATGSYSFHASIADDANYTGGTSVCEPLTVNKADTTTVTHVHNPAHEIVTSVPLGTAVHDNAAVGTQIDGFVIDGKVTYNFYTNNECLGDVAGSETVAVGTESSAQTLGAGSYSFKATYGGNSNYSGSTGACEPFSVTQATPTVTTEVHDSSENVIASQTLDFNVHDSATVSSSVADFAPTGTVTFTFFAGSSCDSTGTGAGTVALVDGLAHPSQTESLLTAGLYSFRAHYNGDSNFNGATSACEPFYLTTLQIFKNTLGGDGTFDYTVSGNTPFSSSIQTSAGSGSTLVTPVLAGTYDVTETVPAGWNKTGGTCGTESNPSAYAISLGQAGTCTFQNTKQGQVIVTKYLDDNVNGVKDKNETGLSGWDILLDSVHQTTDPTGIATFSGVIPGSYTLSETLQGGWHQSSISCDNGTYNSNLQNFSLDVAAGQTVNCTIGNYQNANITVAKVLLDTFGNPISTDSADFNFNIASNSGNVANFDLQGGQNQSFGVTPGTYDVTEADPAPNYAFVGCQAVYGNESIGVPVQFGETVILGSNDTVTVTCTNQQKPGHVQGFKWSDLNGNARWDCNNDEETCEPKLADWTIFADLNGNNILDQGEPSTTTDSQGDYTLALNPGTYKICEVVQAGWVQTYPVLATESECHNVTLSSNETFDGNLNFGNQLQNPILTLTKSNDASGDKHPGDSVLFTLTVTATQSGVNNVTVTDLPANGFHYHSGSWTANSSVRGDLKAGAITPEPTYHSPGLWQLGNMTVGEVVTLTYLTDIDNSIDAGNYPDLAWTQGTSLGSDQVLGNADSGIFVGTNVNVVRTNQGSTSVNIQGQVLGASTSLPSTGQNPLWPILALLLIVFGGGLIGVGKLVKMNKKLSRYFAVILAAFFAAGLIFAHPQSALAISNLSVRVEQPQTPTNQTSFQLTFVTLDLGNRAVAVNCYKKGPSDGSFSNFGGTQTVSAGGNSGSCQVDSGIMNNTGTYQFYVTAHVDAAGGFPAEDQTSSTDTVDYNTSGPGTPSNYLRQQTGSCQFTITFTTANDGKTAAVNLYRSTNTSFNIDSSTQVDSMSIGPNTNGKFINNVPDCGATYYFEIRAFDSAGNGSGVVGDSAGTITINPPTTTTTPASGAIPVSGGTNLPSGPGVLGAENASGAGTGNVLGESTPTGQTVELPTSPSSTGTSLLSGRKPWYLAIGGLIIVGIIAYVLYRRRQNGS